MVLSGREQIVDAIIQHKGQPFLIFDADRGNAGSEAGRPDVHRLNGTGNRPTVIDVDDELQRVTRLHEEAAFDPDPGFTDIQNGAGGGQRSPLQTAFATDLDAGLFAFKSHAATSTA